MMSILYCLMTEESKACRFEVPAESQSLYFHGCKIKRSTLTESLVLVDFISVL